MSQNPKNQEESSNILIIALFALLIKCLYDFKVMGGFNYPLLMKMIYMIFIIFFLVLNFHSVEVKNVIRQTRIEDYFNSIKNK